MRRRNSSFRRSCGHAGGGVGSTLMPSRPGEFHPEPLTDPDLNLSIHPARVIARRLPPSAEPSGSSRFDPVGPCSTAMTCPLCSTGITPLHHYYRAVRPSPAHRYFRPRGWRRLCLVWGFFCQGVSARRRIFYPSSVSLFDPKAVPSSRPAAAPGRRAQELSRLAVAPTSWHAPPLPGHTLTASSTTARLVRSG